MKHEGDSNITWNDLQKFDKGLEKWKIGGRVGPIQTTALLRSARILRRLLET